MFYDVLGGYMRLSRQVTTCLRRVLEDAAYEFRHSLYLSQQHYPHSQLPYQKQVISLSYHCLCSVVHLTDYSPCVADGVFKFTESPGFFSVTAFPMGQWTLTQLFEEDFL